MKLLHTALTIIALAFSGLLAAHSDDYLDTITTPHGGQIRMAGAWHFELVVQPDALTVYVTDHANRPVATQGASGTATVLTGGVRTTVALTAAGQDQLTGSGQFAMDEAMRVVLQITLAGQQPEQARFTPLAPRTLTPAAVTNQMPMPIQEQMPMQDAHQHH